MKVSLTLKCFPKNEVSGLTYFAFFYAVNGNAKENPKHKKRGKATQLSKIAVRVFDL